MSKEYDENFKTPYIFEGFDHVEGEWNTGFVIEDKDKNQFVWIPVYNVEKTDVVALAKKDFVIMPNIPKENCLDEECKKFIKSALENGGFYISRYEIGIDGENIVSKKGKKLLTNITKEETLEKIKNMYKNEEFSCDLINGYAYDTTIKWLTLESQPQIADIDTSVYVLTGRNANKNVFDLFDNVFEYTRRTLL